MEIARRGTGLRDAKDVELTGLSHQVDQCLGDRAGSRYLKEGGEKGQIWTFSVLCGMSWKCSSKNQGLRMHKAA